MSSKFWLRYNFKKKRFIPEKLSKNLPQSDELFFPIYFYFKEIISNTDDYTIYLQHFVYNICSKHFSLDAIN